MSGKIWIEKATGREFEILGYGDGHCPKGWTHLLSHAGVLWSKEDARSSFDQMFLRLLHVRHTAGLNVYEETGEKRTVNKNDSYLNTNRNVNCWNLNETSPLAYTILKPIGTISEDGKTLHKNDGTHEAVE